MKIVNCGTELPKKGFEQHQATWSTIRVVFAVQRIDLAESARTAHKANCAIKVVHARNRRNEASAARQIALESSIAIVI